MAVTSMRISCSASLLQRSLRKRTHEAKLLRAFTTRLVHARTASGAPSRALNFALHLSARLTESSFGLSSIQLRCTRACTRSMKVKFSVLSSFSQSLFSNSIKTRRKFSLTIICYFDSLSKTLLKFSNFLWTFKM